MPRSKTSGKWNFVAARIKLINTDLFVEKCQTRQKMYQNLLFPKRDDKYFYVNFLFLVLQTEELFCDALVLLTL